MTNTSDLKKDIAVRESIVICEKLGTVTSKYLMTVTLKDELIQIASSLMTLKLKISEI